MKVSDCKSTVHAAMNFNDTGFSFLIRGLVGSLERLEVPNASVCAADLVQSCIKMIFSLSVSLIMESTHSLPQQREGAPRELHRPH